MRQTTLYVALMTVIVAAFAMQTAHAQTMPRPVRYGIVQTGDNGFQTSGPDFLNFEQAPAPFPMHGHPIQPIPNGGGPEYAAQPTTGYSAPHSHHSFRPVGHGPKPAAPAELPPGVGPGVYPQTNASLYPTPRPDIPYQTGGTVITNQAFSLHEMLYPHKYRAMYPPYYYKVHGGWMWTPFGIWSHDRWRLQGTEVKVKYHSHIKLFSGFHPPAVW